MHSKDQVRSVIDDYVRNETLNNDIGVILFKWTNEESSTYKYASYGSVADESEVLT